VFQQRTIAEKITCTGSGLHSGAPVQLTMYPAHTDTGVVFLRRRAGEDGDLVEVAARAENVTSTSNATTLTHDGVSVSTVEHLLAALRCLGVDNVRIELDGPEVPVMDGSAASFAYLIRSAGLFVQPQPRSVLVIRRPLEYSDGERSIRIEPCRSFRISYAVDFDHPAIGRQEFEIAGMTPSVFEREIARARTFGFLREVEALWKAGMARGGSLDNTVLLDAERVVNRNGLRWPDEFVRHKVLDLLGDLALLGRPIRGHVKVERGGHSLHLGLMKQILRHKDAWKIERATSPAARDPREHTSPF
jgi:UDP-3-O-[3-hydroxymyristoyl] N-acetylglucosamine deacetylase